MAIDRRNLEFGRRGLELALDRLDFTPFVDVPTTVAEILQWAYALQCIYADHCRHLDRRGDYFDVQKHDQDGVVVYGLMNARNEVVHRLEPPSELVGGAFQAGAFQAGAFQVGRWHWTTAAGDRDDERLRAYLWRVAGQEVAGPLSSLLPWFDTAESHWA